MRPLGRCAGHDLDEYVGQPAVMARHSLAGFIHPKALVQDSVIGARTKVWQFASVIRNAKIGEDCSIATCVIVDGAIVGDRCKIQHGAFIDPGIRIGNDVFIGPQVSLCNDFWPRVDTEDWFDIEDLIEGRVVVTQIDDGASIGANAVVLPGVRIGAGAMIAAGAVVPRDVLPGHLFSRDGAMTVINRLPRRMRTVSA